ncbi:MAG: hypothetical protein ACRDRH_04195, partial [Pseudonocardia sp.]
MLDEERRLQGADYQDRELLFCWSDGWPIYPETITDHFNRLVDRAGLPLITLLSRPGARFRCFHRSVSPGRSPNPSCRSLGNGLSTVSAV